MNPPIAKTRMASSQPFDLPDQWVIISRPGSAISQDRPRPGHDAADPPLRDRVPFAQVTGGGPLLVWGHHFFFAMSWSICLSRSSSATSRLRRSTSSSSSRLGDPSRLFRGRAVVAIGNKSSQQYPPCGRYPKRSALWPDRGPLPQQPRDLLGVPSPSHESLRGSSYRETPISAGPVFGEQSMALQRLRGHQSGFMVKRDAARIDDATKGKVNERTKSPRLRRARSVVAVKCFPLSPRPLAYVARVASSR